MVCERQSCRRPTVSGSRVCRRPRGCARAWPPWPWSAPSATRSRAWPASSACPPRPDACWPAALAEAARLRHRQPPRRRARRRARRCRADRCSQRSGVAVLRRYLDGGDEPAARRAPPQARRRRRAWSSRPLPLRRRRSSAVGPTSPASRRRCAGTPAQAQGWPGNRKAYISTSGATIREHAARVGALRDRVQVHAGRGASRRAAWRSPTPTSRTTDHQGPAGLRRRLQERRVPFHPGRRLTPRPAAPKSD